MLQHSSACLAGNEVWQKVKTSCIREYQALFQALLLAFGDMQNGVVFLYFKTNLWKVSGSRLSDFWKGRACLTERNLLEWLSVCQLRTEMMHFWKHDFTYCLSRIYQSVQNHGIKQCKSVDKRMNTQSGNVLHFSVGVTEFPQAILIPSSCFFSPPCHENV